jgi:hypothetical protein
MIFDIFASVYCSAPYVILELVLTFPTTEKCWIVTNARELCSTQAQTHSSEACTQPSEHMAVVWQYSEGDDGRQSLVITVPWDKGSVRHLFSPGT